MVPAFFGRRQRTMSVAVVLGLVILGCIASGNAASQVAGSVPILRSGKDEGNATSANGTIAHYKSNLELAAALKNFTRRCKHISRLYTIGKSTLGVPLVVRVMWLKIPSGLAEMRYITLDYSRWALEVSDKPGVSEPEPAFKYVGNMHGDEPLGRELVLLLADWLCDNYLKDSMATLIVDQIHLHLLPSMNPDGFAAEPGPRRNNAHDIDLNRDFPDQFFPQNNNEEKRQPETRGVMNWIRSTRFTASASFHEGALVANYPYDGNREVSNKYAVSPDDSTFRYLAGVYASNHPLMSKSKEFTGGVTNGAAWYPLYGGMQDWNYLHGDCLELTLEMNENKWPPPSQIPQIWSEHRKSMIQLVAATVTSGVHGRVMSSREGEPLAASISISGISHAMKASVEFGDYHRLLAPGQVYEVTASMDGYLSRSTHVFLPNHTAIMLDFILDPFSLENGAVSVSGGPRKRAQASRKELSLGEQMWVASGTSFLLVYLVPLVSVVAVAVCLLLTSGGRFRLQAARHRLSRGTRIAGS